VVSTADIFWDVQTIRLYVETKEAKMTTSNKCNSTKLAAATVGFGFSLMKLQVSGCHQSAASHQAIVNLS
jgi:hypothetical protein